MAETFSAAEYLRDELKERGWTVREFAVRINEPTSEVSEILEGKRVFTAEEVNAIAHVLGTSVEMWRALNSAGT